MDDKGPIDRAYYDTLVSERFVAAVLTALAEGPVGQAILGLAEGRRRIVVLQASERQGWIVQTEPVDTEALQAYGDAHVAEPSQGGFERQRIDLGLRVP